MLPGEFELYGHRFRWMEQGQGKARPDEDAIALVHMRGRFPSAAVNWLRPGDSRVPAYGKLGEYSVYQFEGIARFVFPSDGSFVEAYVHPEADHEILDFTLNRGVLPRILHLRGTTCLHASAVEVDGEVVAFCGQSGAGKSTLSAALVDRGLPLVTDDVLPLRAGPAGRVLAGPGLPELRVYPAAAELIGIGERVDAPLEGQTKARWQPRRAPDAPLPLRAVYILEPSLRGASTEPAMLWPLARPAALLDLISNSFWVHSHETGALGQDMLCLGRLLRSVEVSRLSFELSETGFAAVEELIGSAVKAKPQ